MRIETFRPVYVAHVSSNARLDDLVQTGVDLVFLPEVLLQALHPLEVRDDDAAGVREHVRKDQHAVRFEDVVGGGRDRPVRAFDDHLRLDLRGVLLGDDLLERARREHVAVDRHELLVRDAVAALQLGERAAVALVRERSCNVDAVRVEDAARRVGDGDDLRAELRDELGEERADVAEALDRDSTARPSGGSGFSSADSRQKRPPRAVASSRPSEPPIVKRLAGDDAEHGVALVHRVGVEHPRHRRRVRADVRRGDVLLRADLVDDLRGEPARHALELAARHRLRVADHAALRAAERQAHQRALPRHPHRERLDLVERDVGVIANAALRRAARDVVRDADSR